MDPAISKSPNAPATDEGQARNTHSVGATNGAKSDARNAANEPRAKQASTENLNVLVARK